MTTSIVPTVIGKDHPGIFAALSEVLANHDGNWTESSVSTLAGQFAGILLATVSSGLVSVADLAEYIDARRAEVRTEWRRRNAA